MASPLYLTTRGHVDLCRVASALCPSARFRS
ncbi:putative leader peptide [Streptosporangium saharense]